MMLGKDVASLLGAGQSATKRIGPTVWFRARPMPIDGSHPLAAEGAPSLWIDPLTEAKRDLQSV